MGAPTFGQTGGTGGGNIILGPDYPVEETPTGTIPGTLFSTSINYAAIWVFLNGVRQKPVVGTPALGEFKYVGSNLTMGTLVESFDWLSVLGFTTAPLEEVPTGTLPGTIFTTSVAYLVQRVWLNGIRQKQVGAAPNIGQYTYSGTTIVMGTTVDTSDWLVINGLL